MTDTHHHQIDVRDLPALDDGAPSNRYDPAAELADKQKRKQHNDRELKKLRDRREQINGEVKTLTDENGLLVPDIARLEKRVDRLKKKAEAETPPADQAKGKK